MRYLGSLLLSAALFSCRGFASQDCQPVPGLDEILQSGTVLLLGEMHGTVEGPRFLSNAVCRALGRDLQVTVGLEIPIQEDASVERFLKSADQADDVSRLLSSGFWSREYQDGRSSLASVIAAEPDRLFLVLTGNLHNRLAKSGSQEPMGYRVSRETTAKRVISLNMGHQGGSAWVCFGAHSSDCGKQRLAGSAARSEGIELFEEAGQTAYSGRYYVGKINASPPAKEN